MCCKRPVHTNLLRGSERALLGARQLGSYVTAEAVVGVAVGGAEACEDRADRAHRRLDHRRLDTTDHLCRSRQRMQLTCSARSMPSIVRRK